MTRVARHHRAARRLGTAAAALALGLVGACSSQGERMDLERADGSTVARPTSTASTASSSSVGTATSLPVSSDPTDPTDPNDPGAPGGTAGELGATCTWALPNVTVQYPTGWFTPDPGAIGGCVLFDPAPFTVPVDTESPDVAISASYDERALDSAAATLFDPIHWTILDEQRTTFDGRPGGCWRTSSTGQGLDELGTNRESCLVQLEGRTVGFSAAWGPDEEDPELGPTLRAMASSVTDA